MVQENRVIVICGPTASGKSKMAIEIAKELNTEIISADSLAIYKNLDIGTAKPTIEERSQVKHHMIDCVNPTDNFTVGDYCEMAEPILNSLLNKGKIPIICGGTGYYIKSLLYNFSYGNVGANQEIRNYYQDILNKYGKDYLFNILREKDYETSLKLYPNDTMRVIRALEIFDQTGIKKSEIKDELIPKYNYFAFTPYHEREVLYDRINQRVDIMLKNGLIEEVKSLINSGITIDNQCMQGIGYKEVYDAIINNCFYNLGDIIKQNTRRYAKRQITFFKKLEGIEFVEDNYKSVILNKLK